MWKCYSHLFRDNYLIQLMLYFSFKCKNFDIYVLCMQVFVVCAHICSYTHYAFYRGQRIAFDILFCHLGLTLLRQGFSVNLESSWQPESLIHVLAPAIHNARVTDMCFYVQFLLGILGFQIRSFLSCKSSYSLSHVPSPHMKNFYLWLTFYASSLYCIPYQS